MISWGGGAPTPKVGVLTIYFAENCMKMKEFGSRGASLAPPLDPPMKLITHHLQNKNLIVTYLVRGRMT